MDFHGCFTYINQNLENAQMSLRSYIKKAGSAYAIIKLPQCTFKVSYNCICQFYLNKAEKISGVCLYNRILFANKIKELLIDLQHG